MKRIVRIMTKFMTGLLVLGFNFAAPSGNGAAFAYDYTIEEIASGLFAPTGLALDSSGNFYVAEYGKNRINLIESSMGNRTIVADSGQGILKPVGLAWDAEGNLLISCNLGAILRYNLVTQLVSVLADSLGFLPGDIEMGTADTLYVSEFDYSASWGAGSRVFKMSAATGEILAEYSVGNGPYGLSYHPSRQQLLVAHLSDHSLRQIDLTNGVVTDLHVQDQPVASLGDIVRLPNGYILSTEIITGHDISDQMLLIDVLAPKVISAIEELKWPFSVTMDRDNRIFITTIGDGKIWKLNGFGEKAAVPRISPPGRSYTSALTVSIETITEGAAIHYTTDGSDPTIDSPPYSAPFMINTQTTIKAIAVKDGLETSAVAKEVYFFDNFSRNPAAIYIADTSAVIEWSMKTPAPCSLFYSMDRQNWTSAPVASLNETDYQASLSGLIAETQYFYRIFWYADDSIGGASVIYAFQTLYRVIEKKFQLSGKPRHLYVGDTDFLLAVGTDQPVLGLCRLYSPGGDTVVAVDTLPGMEHAFSFSGLPPGTACEYQLGARAIDPPEDYYADIIYSVQTRMAVDRIAPILVAGPFVSVSHAGSLVSFTANEGCQSVLHLFQGAEEIAIDTFFQPDYLKEHQFLLSGLQSGVFYRFTLTLTDKAGNRYDWNGEPSLMSKIGLELPGRSARLAAAGSGNNGFTTSTNADVLPPVFVVRPSLLAVYDSAAALQWELDEPGRFTIEVRTAENRLIANLEIPDYYYRPTVFLTRLEPACVYTARVNVIDLAGNNVENPAELSFYTLSAYQPSAAHLLGPVETFVSAEYAAIAWNTDAACDSRSRLSLFNALSPGDYFYESALTRDHLIVFDNLQQSNPYYFAISGYDFRERPVFENAMDSLVTATTGDQQLLHIVEGPSAIEDTAGILRIEWTTDHLASSFIDYWKSGESEPDTITASRGVLTVNHCVYMTHLESSAEYEVHVHSGTLEGITADTTLRVLASAIVERGAAMADFQLFAPYPNPFRSHTTLPYYLSNPGDVTFEIYNCNGQGVATIGLKHVNAGNHTLVWNGTDSRGSRLSSGVYVIKASANGSVRVKKVLLLN